MIIHGIKKNATGIWPTPWKGAKAMGACGLTGIVSTAPRQRPSEASNRVF